MKRRKGGDANSQSITQCNCCGRSAIAAILLFYVRNKYFSLRNGLINRTLKNTPATILIM